MAAGPTFSFLIDAALPFRNFTLEPTARALDGQLTVQELLSHI
jgi:hypothetical protein